jgi:ABC-type bacteriocin/lantibiotic exporter with double-glycine peptidase domain
MTANLRNRVEDLQNPSGASEGNGSVRRLLQRSVVYLRPYWKQHVTILLGVVLGVAFDIGLPYSLKFLIDGAIVPRDGQMLQLILGGLVVLFLLASLNPAKLWHFLRASYW